MKQFDVKAVIALSLVLALGFTFSCGKTEEQESKSESAPFLVISSVTITPENPISSSLLQVVVKPQHVGLVTYAYRWMSNGEEIVDETESTLKSEFFSKGDTIEVEVTPYQNEVGGKPAKSEPVVILNTPPVMRSFTIDPSPAYSKDDLTAALDVLDADDDYIRIAYQWKKNNQALPGETDATLAKTLFTKGDTIRCEVHISDDESEEVVFHSSEIDILNSAPLITSQLSGMNTEGYLFEYTVVVEDLDGDSLELSLASEPEGMTIDSSTGMVRWEVREDQRKGSYEFKVIATDPEGAQAIQPITLTLSSDEN
jgi:hypothetical protein